MSQIGFAFNNMAYELLNEGSHETQLTLESIVNINLCKSV